jgi:hypothetical protein
MPKPPSDDYTRSQGFAETFGGGHGPTRESSPDLKTELMNAIIGALDAHTAMST